MNLQQNFISDLVLAPIQQLIGGGGYFLVKRLLGVFRWMGSHFHNWTDYNGVANFRDFWDKKILVCRDLKIGKFAVEKWFLLLF